MLNNDYNRVVVSKETAPSNTSLPSVMPVTPESSPAESPPPPPLDAAVSLLSTLSDPGDKQGASSDTVTGGKDSEEEEDVSLPKSTGQLRLVPFASLMSPSFVRPPDDDEETDSPSVSRTSTPIPAPAVSAMGPMVAIPRQTLAELEVNRSSSPASVAGSRTGTPSNPVLDGNFCLDMLNFCS